ncbi:MAG: hypothetical protein UT08_C0013G0008 [Candidatus Woesebacteria bacterium GW2011_GWB1_38_8]|uniref:Uncharacterized protein n=1 Tax=Candidatus Woesebacteria bacterium GW2011_GWB1_38_8 TaxID=1618570 RepID=A0A0G0P6C1_9BACT|nr:MAG: hypothetical protein UT08_C0013G0008 [Candidatus Woesebacteria bacterium GW2011_GWB1_38_8]
MKQKNFLKVILLDYQVNHLFQELGGRGKSPFAKRIIKADAYPCWLPKGRR